MFSTRPEVRALPAAGRGWQAMVVVGGAVQPSRSGFGCPVDGRGWGGVPPQGTGAAGVVRERDRRAAIARFHQPADVGPFAGSLAGAWMRSGGGAGRMGT
jgi:hypothetical protein